MYIKHARSRVEKKSTWSATSTEFHKTSIYTINSITARLLQPPHHSTNMKYFTTISMLAMATMAMASPAVQARNYGGGGGGGSSTCNNNQQSVCCQSVLSLICLVDILGGNCNGGTFCCDEGASVVSYYSCHIHLANWKALTVSFLLGRFDQLEPVELCPDPLNKKLGSASLALVIQNGHSTLAWRWSRVLGVFLQGFYTIETYVR
jgi:hypothetical protein